MLKTVTSYAEAGFSVIPINSDKKAKIKWTAFQQQAATTEQVKQWWGKWPDAMVGVVTGEISGLTVVDCDSDAGADAVREFLSEDVIEKMPVVKTPKGYHFYFEYEPGIVNGVRVLTDTDVRNDGGYVIAPPSENGNGKYKWLQKTGTLPKMPAMLAEMLKDPDGQAQNARGKTRAYKNKTNTLYTRARGGAEKPHETTEKPQNGTNDHKDHKFFEKGSRDNSLFTVANALVKNGCDENLTRQTIEILAKNCEPEFSRKEALKKIESAEKRTSRRERNIAAEVREWVETTSGNFETTSCHKELHLTTKEEIKAANMALSRLAEGPDALLEKHGTRRGCYRRIDRTVEFMDFKNADPEDYLNVSLPLCIHQKTRLFPKSAIVAAGVSGMGKTLFALNVIKMNMGHYPIFYFNSEMGPEALKHKLQVFPVSIQEWGKNMKVVDNWDFRNVADKIQPDALNVVDYLEPEGDKAFDIHNVISSIIRRLNRGLALILIQKRPDAKTGTGGVYSIKAATLALALDWGRLEVTKNRFREADPNPDKNNIKFNVKQGWHFEPDGDWYRE